MSELEFTWLGSLYWIEHRSGRIAYVRCDLAEDVGEDVTYEVFTDALVASGRDQGRSAVESMSLLYDAVPDLDPSQSEPGDDWYDEIDRSVDDELEREWWR